MSPRNTIDLAVIGNSTFGALIDEAARIVWSCLPRLDGDPVFSDLLDGGKDPSETASFDILLKGYVRSEQAYDRNSAILRTRLFDDKGGCVEVTDFAPRFKLYGRMFKPIMLVRRVRTVAGSPAITIRLKPRFDYGAVEPEITYGSNHIRYVGQSQTLRLTTDAPLSYVLDQTPFLLTEPVSLLLGPDESVSGAVGDVAREFEEKTRDYWQNWVRGLALPLNYQEAVIRAAITLKLCVFEETGAIVAAHTTSIPEAAHTERNWDYRFCWLRDAFFVVRALNSLAAVKTMERYLGYLGNILDRTAGGHIQPVYGIALESDLIEQKIETLSGYRGMGPVRAGNQAYEHLQHDVYGNILLAASQAFFDERLLNPPGLAEFERFELVGERAFDLHNAPDAGMWEYRTRARVHTSSTLMCWAACDRLSKIATKLGRADRAAYWAGKAAHIHKVIIDEAYDPKSGGFVESFGGDRYDAGVLLMGEVGFLPADDPRFIATVDAIGKELKRGNHLFRYAMADDFGEPENAFNICTFWYIDALARIGRKDEARDMFEAMLATRNRLGLLSEDTTVATGEHWGNYPQTYSLVGIINAAMRLSDRWEDMV